MKFQVITLLACTVLSVVAAPQSLPTQLQSLHSRDSALSNLNSLEKRKGGGGGRGGGGGSSGGGRSGTGGGYGSYPFSSSSNVGGRTRDGSGTPKTYGNSYTGGAQVPYTAGGASPSRRIAPLALPIAAVAFFPAIWLFPVYAYPWPIGYHWYAGGRNHTSNVTCLCEEYSVCGCDPTDNSTFLASVLANGSADGAPVNTSMVRTVDFGNGTVNSYINGSLANGTTASGGTDPSNESQVSSAVRLIAGYTGYWIMVATVISAVTLL